MTRGLMGTWNFDATDDFTSPDGTFATQTAMVDTNIRSTHEWAMKCEKFFCTTMSVELLVTKFCLFTTGVLHDKETENIGRSLFTHSNGQSSNTFFDKDWQPEYDFKPLLPDNV